MSTASIVPVGFKGTIQPADIFIAKNVPGFAAMLGMFDRMEHNMLAASFVLASQEAGHWVGLVYPTKAASNTDFGEMVALGYLSETQAEGGWLYALTQLAVEKIYVRQASPSLPPAVFGPPVQRVTFEVDTTNDGGFWAWFRKIFAW